MNLTAATIARGLGRAAVALVAIAILVVLLLVSAAIRLVSESA